jgi:hypothetical protein
LFNSVSHASIIRENSYASHSDADVGQSVIDRYSKAIKDFMDDAVSSTAAAGATTNNQNGMLPFDDATVAVMERLTLHDALVRIPMNHGDLGPNSHVGHSDQLCTRKMNSVPLSDFFASASVVRERRQGGIVEGAVTSTIWMGSNTLSNDNKDLRRAQLDDLEKQCQLDSAPHTAYGQNERREQKESVRTKGMHPTDPQFLIFVSGFVLCVAFASRIW